jgi:hypothetical protein
MFREGNNPQDTLGSGIDSITPKTGVDSLKQEGKQVIKSEKIIVAKDSVPDVLMICPRNYFANITFADSGITLRITKNALPEGFPSLLIKSARQIQLKQYTALKEKLRAGKTYQADNLYSDWILGIIIVSAFLISFIHSNRGSALKNFFKSFSLKGSNSEVSRDIGGLFHWQSTLINLVSFLNIGLFIYFIQRYYNLIPGNLPQLLLWFAFFMIIVIAITLRHFICTSVGNISGREDAFREYLYGIYQMYRLLGLIYFILIIIISYTTLIPAKTCFIIGLFVVSVLYLLRILRLLIIFIKRHISIFYFILYLCALEILPAVVLFKFVTGIK